MKEKARRTVDVFIIDVQEGEMVAVWDGEQLLGSVGFFPLIIWTDPNVRYYCMLTSQEDQTTKTQRRGRHTGKHGYDGENLVTAPELRADDEHLGHLVESRT